MAKYTKNATNQKLAKRLQCGSLEYQKKKNIKSLGVFVIICCKLVHIKYDFVQVTMAQQLYKHRALMAWICIPLALILLMAAAYISFAWSRSPRRKHVVLIDRKPQLPSDPEIETAEVHEKKFSSPTRDLYATPQSKDTTLEVVEQDTKQSQKKSKKKKKNLDPEMEWEDPWEEYRAVSGGEYESSFNNYESSFQSEKNHTYQIKNDKNLPQPKLRDRFDQRAILSDQSRSSGYFSSDSEGRNWKYQDDAEWGEEKIKCEKKSKNGAEIDNSYSPTNNKLESSMETVHEDKEMEVIETGKTKGTFRIFTCSENEQFMKKYSKQLPPSQEISNSKRSKHQLSSLKRYHFIEYLMKDLRIREENDIKNKFDEVRIDFLTGPNRPKFSQELLTCNGFPDLFRSAPKKV
jgi:hypothetical protein